MRKNITRMLLSAMGRAGRPYLQMVGLLKTSKAYGRSAIVWEPGQEKVLVLAPHMDDEVIGCGGTLARHVSSGADVTVAFLTDGRYGGIIPAGTPETERKHQQDRLVETRKREAKEALDILGIHKLVFFDAEDGRLGESDDTAKRLRAILEELRPQVVYVPFFLEGHVDHQAVTAVLAKAVEGTTPEFLCLGYEVWTPLFPNCFVNIDATVELKRTALQQYKSQLAQADYLHTAFGLSAFRSNAFLGGTCRYAEAFNALPVSEYLELYRGHNGSSAH